MAQRMKTRRPGFKTPVCGQFAPSRREEKLCYSRSWLSGSTSGISLRACSNSSRLKSWARDSRNSRLARRFATAADTNSSTDTWSLACDLSGLVVQILGYCDALAHVPSSSIVLKNSRGVVTRMPNRSAPAKCLILCVTMASAWPATASSRRNSSPGSGRNGSRSRK